LSSDSPEMIIVIEAGAPSSLSMETTATGSVAARTAPKLHAREALQSYGNTLVEYTAVRKVPKTTPGKARMMHCEAERLATCQSRWIDSAMRRGGKKMLRSRWPSISCQRLMDS